MTDQVKATRVRRVSVDSLNVNSSADQGDHIREVVGHFSVNGEVLQYAALPDATIAKMVAYGTTQLVNDALAGEDDKEAALEAVIARIKSGDWSATRTASSGISLRQCAIDTVKAVLKRQGKSATAKDIGALADKMLADKASKGYAAAFAEWQRRNAPDIEGIDEIDL